MVTMDQKHHRGEQRDRSQRRLRHQ
jgi:hypothetical protein